jgi:hypothetical protein
MDSRAADRKQRRPAPQGAQTQKTTTKKNDKLWKKSQ